MPYKTEWVEPEVFYQHNGITIYRTYTGGNDDEPSQYHFTTHPTEEQESLANYQFDIRDVERQLVPLGFTFVESQSQLRIKDILRRAIERNLIQVPPAAPITLEEIHKIAEAHMMFLVISQHPHEYRIMAKNLSTGHEETRYPDEAREFVYAAADALSTCLDPNNRDCQRLTTFLINANYEGNSENKETRQTKTRIIKDAAEAQGMLVKEAPAAPPMDPVDLKGLPSSTVLFDEQRYYQDLKHIKGRLARLEWAVLTPEQKQHYGEYFPSDPEYEAKQEAMLKYQQAIAETPTNQPPEPITLESVHTNGFAVYFQLSDGHVGHIAITGAGLQECRPAHSKRNPPASYDGIPFTLLTEKQQRLINDYIKDYNAKNNPTV